MSTSIEELASSKDAIRQACAGVRYRPRAARGGRSRNDEGTRRTLISAQPENIQPEIPLVRKRHTQTLILAIGYFHRLLGILTEFSVREHAGPQAYGRGHRGSAQHRNCLFSRPARPRPGCCRLSRGRPRARLRCRDRPSQPESASQIRLPGPCPQTSLIGDGSGLNQHRLSRHRVSQTEAAYGECGPSRRSRRILADERLRLLRGSEPARFASADGVRLPVRQQGAARSLPAVRKEPESRSTPAAPCAR